jgi:hypothetical protein
MYAMRQLGAWTAAGTRLGGVAGWNLLHCPAQGRGQIVCDGLVRVGP